MSGRNSCSATSARMCFRVIAKNFRSGRCWDWLCAMKLPWALFFLLLSSAVMPCCRLGRPSACLGRVAIAYARIYMITYLPMLPCCVHLEATSSFERGREHKGDSTRERPSENDVRYATARAMCTFVSDMLTRSYAGRSHGHAQAHAIMCILSPAISCARSLRLFSLCLSVSLSFPISFCVFRSLSHSFCFYLALFLCLSVPLSPSLTNTHGFSLCLSLSFWSLSLCLSLSVSFSHAHSLSHRANARSLSLSL